MGKKRADTQVRSYLAATGAACCALFGVVDEQDNPYEPLVERMAEVNLWPYGWPGLMR